MSFEFTSPRTLDEALELWHDKAQWFAGGTDLVGETKTALAQPTRLINLKPIAELRGIREMPNEIRIGALATLTELAESELVREHYLALAQACDLSASPQLRNAATIGGNLNQDSRCPYYRGPFNCWLKGGEICFMREGGLANREGAVVGYHECVHVHPSDPINALVALDAKIIVRTEDGLREIPAGDFCRAPSGNDKRMNALHPKEIITEIRLPKFNNARSAYEKAMDRAAFTFALASAAVRLDFDGERIADARLVVGGVAPIPWREKMAETVLRGQILTDSLAQNAADQVLLHARTLTHNAYKVRLARALVKRAIMECHRSNNR